MASIDNNKGEFKMERNEDKVIQLKKTAVPTDLMTLSKLSEKYNLTYDYLYKITTITNELPFYKRGRILVSESAFVTWMEEGYVA